MGLKVDARLIRSKNAGSVLLGGGETPAIRQAIARAMNEHLRMQERNAVRTISYQTMVPQGRVGSVTRVFHASAASLSGHVEVADAAIPIKKYGVVRTGQRTGYATMHGVRSITAWRGTARYFGAFVVPAFGGNVFRRVGRKSGDAKGSRGPIQKVWGPVLPNELLRSDQPNFPQMVTFAQIDLTRRIQAAILRIIS
jgi:hypothetical protein